MVLAVPAPGPRVVAMTAGSLLPAMVCHAIADLVSGDLGYRALATDAAGTGTGRAADDSAERTIR